MIERIYILNGKGGAGKDTFVDMVKEDIEDRNLGYEIVHTSIIDPIKAIMSLMGWKGGKERRDRELMHKLKIIFENYNDSPFNYIRKYLLDVLKEDEYSNIIFIDMREDNDIVRFLREFKEYNPKTIYIQRNEVEKKVYGNKADDEADTMEVIDIMIYNNEGLEELREQAKEFVDKYV